MSKPEWMYNYEKIVDDTPANRRQWLHVCSGWFQQIEDED